MLLLVLFATLQSSSSLAMRTIDQGPVSRISQPRQALVRSADEWATLWAAHAPNRPLPPIDFSKEMVVGVWAGTRPTSGFAVEIESVSAAATGGLLVRYRERPPGRDVMTAQVLTAPYQLVAVPATPGSVTFQADH